MSEFQDLYSSQRERARVERLEKEKLSKENDSLQVQVKEVAEGAKHLKEQVGSLSSLLTIKEQELTRFKNGNAELTLVKAELEKARTALKTEAEKVRMLELDLAEKDVATRVKALEDILGGSSLLIPHRMNCTSSKRCFVRRLRDACLLFCFVLDFYFALT